MTIRIIQCMSCVHLRRGTGWTCDAYWEKIPLPILDNDADHRFPLAGDHGILWERDPNAHFENPFVDEGLPPMTNIGVRP